MKVDTGELEIAVHEFGGHRAGPVLLWTHANGLAARGYGPMLRAIAEEMPVFAIDLRGHGDSGAVQPPYEESLALARMAQDLCAVLGALPLAGVPVYAAGHSLGALPIVRCLAEHAAIRAAVLFEAAIYPPADSPLHAEAAALTAERVEKIPRRRRNWASAPALAEGLRKSPAFSPVPAADLEELCREILEPDPSSGLLRLKCDPAVEGFLFSQVARGDEYNALSRVRVPVLVVGGDAGHPGATWVTRFQRGIHDAIEAASFVEVAGAGHMLPLERPGECARIALEWIGRVEREHRA